MKRLVACALVAACGRTPVPRRPEPSATVRDEIAAAEQAERGRRHDVARSHYERAVGGAIDPASRWLAHREFAETLATWGEYRAAIAHYEAALAARADDAAAWHDLGILRFHEEDRRGAIAALERSIALAPRDFRPRRTLAVLHWKTGARDRARVEYTRMLELELPERVRASVEWALAALAKPAP